jgi:hypothetical protein
MITPSDFVGKFEVHKGMYATSKLEAYIERYVEQYLTEMFGVELYQDFMFDLSNGVPDSPRFAFFYYPFKLDIPAGIMGRRDVIISRGIKDMLLGFVYFEYCKDLMNQQTTAGSVVPQSENSFVNSTLFTLMYARYNESIRTYRSIQKVLSFYPSYYFGGVTQLGIIDGGTGVAASTDALTTHVELIPKGVASYQIQTSGTGYSNGSNIQTTTNGIGTGFTANIVVNNGVVTNISPVNIGTNYSPADVITLNGGNNNCTIKVLDIKYNYEILNEGNGLSVSYTVNQQGTITLAAVKDYGQGYEVGDIVMVKNGGKGGTPAFLQVLNVDTKKIENFNGVYKEYNYWI